MSSCKRGNSGIQIGNQLQISSSIRIVGGFHQSGGFQLGRFQLQLSDSVFMRCLKLCDGLAVFVGFQDELSMPRFGLPFKLFSPCGMRVNLALEVICPKVNLGAVSSYFPVHLIDIVTQRINVDMSCRCIQINANLLLQHVFTIFKFFIYRAQINVCVLFIHIDPCVIELVEVFFCLLIRSRTCSAGTSTSGRIVLFLSLVLTVSLGQGLLRIAKGIGVVRRILKVILNSCADQPHGNPVRLRIYQNRIAKANFRNIFVNQVHVHRVYSKRNGHILMIGKKTSTILKQRVRIGHILKHSGFHNAAILRFGSLVH